MPHEFDSTTETPPAPPRLTGNAPRMTDAEARAVIQLWQSEGMGSPERDRPTPADMAEGLDISPDDAVRLLSQVRAERQAAQDAARAAAEEGLARAERAAHLAELRARQAEAEVREARARQLMLTSPRIVEEVSPFQGIDAQEGHKRAVMFTVVVALKLLVIFLLCLHYS